MSTLLGSLAFGLYHKRKAEESIEELLEENDHPGLEEKRKDAAELLEDYDRGYRLLEEKGLENPVRLAFVYSFVSDPRNFWKNLGYCEALGESSEYGESR